MDFCSFDIKRLCAYDFKKNIIKELNPNKELVSSYHFLSQSTLLNQMFPFVSMMLGALFSTLLHHHILQPLIQQNSFDICKDYITLVLQTILHVFRGVMTWCIINVWIADLAINTFMMHHVICTTDCNNFRTPYSFRHSFVIYAWHACYSE